jgi:hypothetical protein
MSIGTAIYAALVTGFIVLMITQLIDYERARKQAERDRRRDIRRDFERKMDELRSERPEGWGEIRMTVRQRRKNNKRGAA